MDRVELEGGIEVRFKEYLVKTDRAVYERASTPWSLPGPCPSPATVSRSRADG